MVVINVAVDGCGAQTIVIGRRATYETLQVVFNISYLIETYGNGAAVLVAKRSQDETAYPATVTQDGNTLTWIVSETDTYYVGAGECELMWYVNGGLAKTIIYQVVVLRDMLQTTEEPPDAYENWIEHLTALGAETQQNALDAAQSATDAENAATRAEDALEEFTTPTASATSLAPDQQATADYSDGHFSFGIPRGTPGTTGETPDFSIGTVETLEPDQPATATITGTPENPVLNLGIPKGEKGEDGGGAVESVNGKTGVVVLEASDVGAKPASYEAPVSSVAGKTGAVTLDAGDVSFDDSATYASGTVGAELSNQKNAIDAKAPVIINTASGEIASFADGADGMQIRKIVGTIVTPEGGSGKTNATIKATGENLAIGSLIENAILTQITETRRGIGSNGWVWFQPASGSGYPSIFGLSKATYKFKPNTQYTIMFQVTSQGDATNYNIGLSYTDNTSRQFTKSDRNEAGWIVFVTNASKSCYSLFVGPYAPNNWTSINQNTMCIMEGVHTFEELKEQKNQLLTISWETEAGVINNGSVTLNEDGSADVINSDTEDSYHLTNVGSLSTYYGTNNLWINTGVITECDYPADTKLYIDGISEPDEDMIADGVIASGKYFMVNNQFYLSTASIAAGAQIIPGTNCTAKNLVEILNEINS